MRRSPVRTISLYPRYKKLNFRLTKDVQPSFAYLELFLSVTQILKAYYIKPYGISPLGASIEAELPLRREWVAAVPTAPLHVFLQSRA